jgi:hypothetical protein
MANANPVLDDIRRLKREFAALKSMKIIVGIQGDEDSEVLKIAGVHEFGCTIEVTPKMRAYLHNVGLHLKETTKQINIPERSFIRASYKAGKVELDEFSRAEVNRVVIGERTARQAADSIGLYCVQMTQSFIDEDKVKPPDSEYTLEHKTQKTTLYESGTHIRDRITYRIEEGTGGD